MDDLIDMASAFEENANQDGGMKATAPKTAEEETRENIEAATRKYTVDDPNDPAHGCIPAEFESNWAVATFSGILKANVRKAADIDAAHSDQAMMDTFSSALIGCRGRIFTGLKKVTTKGPDGEETTYEPVLRSPTCSLQYKQAIRLEALGDFIANYVPRSPVLAHDPDPVRAAELASGLMPNVVDPWAAMTALQNLCENVHSACHTPGAEHRHKAFVAQHKLTGGNGKSKFFRRFAQACDELGVDCGMLPRFDKQYPPAMAALQLVTIIEDVAGMVDKDDTYVNGLIDRAPAVDYGKKYGAKGQCKSYTTVLFGTNYDIYDANAYRYDIVRYTPENVANLTDEEHRKYFPHWYDELAAVDAMKELIRVMPFRSEHPEWKKPEPKYDIAKATPPTLVVDERWSMPLTIIQRALLALDRSCVCFQAGLQDIGRVNADEPTLAKYKSQLSSVRPCTFAKWCTEILSLEGDEKKNFHVAFRKFVSQMRSDGKLSYKGSKDPFTAEQDMYVFAMMTCDATWDEENGVSPLEYAARQWRQLIEEEKVRQQNKNEN